MAKYAKKSHLFYWNRVHAEKTERLLSIIIPEGATKRVGVRSLETCI
jgi:hypothetical protein